MATRTAVAILRTTMDRPAGTTPEASLASPARIADLAVAWAMSRLGDRTYTGKCYGFIEDAIEYGNGIVLDGQGSTATEAADAYHPTTTGTPPRGAYVFYDCTGPLHGATRNWGHMGLSLGDGRVIHAWDTVRIDDLHGIEQLTPRPGWTRPAYRGWVPIERVLVNAAPGTPGTPGPSHGGQPSPA